MNLTDASPFPFGKHEGTPMQDVPVEYLHWLWENTNPWNAEGVAVREYTKRSLDALKMENKDLIWSRK